MHFQIPPHDHAKVVYVVSGKILDVILDLRKESSTYGQYFSVQLSAVDPSFLYIPSGMAHGFLSLEDNSKVLYMQTTTYSSECDKGILWNSFGVKWPLLAQDAIISQRDLAHPPFADFTSPF